MRKSLQSSEASADRWQNYSNIIVSQSPLLNQNSLTDAVDYFSKKNPDQMNSSLSKEYMQDSNVQTSARKSPTPARMGKEGSALSNRQDHGLSPSVQSADLTDIV